MLRQWMAGVPLGLGLALLLRTLVPEEHALEPAQAPTNTPSAPTRSASPTPSAPRLSQQAADLSAIQSQLDELAAGQDAIAADLGAVEAQQPDDAPARAPLRVADPAAAQRELLEAQMRSETADPAWASAAETSVRTAMGQLDLGTVRSVTCLTSACRMVVDAPAGTDPVALAEALGTAPPWPANVWTQVSTTEPPVAEVWIAREGGSLPRLPGSR